ncbi:MAG: hypothetical protein BWX80_01374 [Candidatus Hydrogenedentes bacterium ADurb.Bin101]|nr:MAG: hypothetical protein BWX80_01374 [Candidatus Hydrogenedentes bacterium ADurb.Bin101]
MDNEIGIAVLVAFKGHRTPLHIRQRDHQVLVQHLVLQRSLRQITVPPLFKLKGIQAAGTDLRFDLRFDHFHAQVKLSHLFPVTQWQLIRRGAVAGQQLADIGNPYYPAAPRRNGKHACFKRIAFRVFHQPRIDALPHNLFKHLAAFFFLHHHAVHHAAVDIQGVPAHRRPFRQWEIEVPCQRTVIGIGKSHRHARLGQAAGHLHVHRHARDGHGLCYLGTRRVGNNNQGRRQVLGIQRHGKQYNTQNTPKIPFHKRLAFAQKRAPFTP